VVYFSDYSKMPIFTPSHPKFTKIKAENSGYPIVVKRDASVVYYEVPHAVFARFTNNENGLLVDSNDVPVIELFTMCCDSQRARFSQHTHLKQAGGQAVLIAGVIIQDWSQVCWDNGYYV
jgi:hypothetical protein